MVNIIRALRERWRSRTHSHTHLQTHTCTICSFWFGFFCGQFLLFSILQQVSVLSIHCILPLCPSTHTHPCGSTSFLERQKPCIIFCYLLLQMEPSFDDLVVSRPPPSACVFIYSDLSHFLSFPAWPLILSTCLCLFRPISLFFSLSPLLSLCIRVSSFCYQSCFHNNCDLSVSA